MDAQSEQVIAAQKHLWTIGDYPAVARRMMDVARSTVELAGVGPDQRVLDVATGDGNAAVVAAKLGAAVTGIDLTPAQVEKAVRRCGAEDVDVELCQADAQALPCPGATFDAVISVLGVIFAPDHERALSEMVRVCRPDGVVALASWAEGGWMGRWRAAAATELLGDDAMPVPAAGGPEAWGDPEEVTRRFSAAGLTVEVHERVLDWSFPSVEGAVDFYLESSGPFVAFMDDMRSRGLDGEAHELLLASLTAANRATGEGCRLVSPYLVAIARIPG